MNAFTYLDLFNEFGKEITKEFERTDFTIQVGNNDEPVTCCAITIEDDSYEIEVFGEQLTDDQYRLIEECCEIEIQSRKDHRAFCRDIEETEKWLMYN